MQRLRGKEKCVGILGERDSTRNPRICTSAAFLSSFYVKGDDETQGGESQMLLTSSFLLSPHLLLKTHWKRRSEGRDLWISHPMGFEEVARRADTRRLQLRFSICVRKEMHPELWLALDTF